MRIRKNGKIVRLTESDLQRIVRRIMKEEEEPKTEPTKDDEDDKTLLQLRMELIKKKLQKLGALKRLKLEQSKLKRLAKRAIKQHRQDMKKEKISEKIDSIEQDIKQIEDASDDKQCNDKCVKLADKMLNIRKSIKKFFRNRRRN